MTPEQWRQARQLFEDALDHEPAAREAFVRESCGEDRRLFEEVASLLASYDKADDVFLNPVIEAITTPDRFEGRQLGPYRILHRLGHGGMGAVYMAERADDQFRRRVAVKLVRPGFDDGQLQRRFSNERHMLAVLDHPNIVKLLDAGVTDDGIPYFVMDYVEGQPIDKYCQTQGLSIPEKLALFREVCAAVHYAHRNLVVHRDLKPSNILVTTGGAIKLLDFGIAKLLRPEYGTGAIGLTRTLQPMTPEYASPEQVQGQPITTSSDVYSLGVLLYRLVAGKHPYEMNTNSAAEMERIVCETTPERPSLLIKREAGWKRLGASDLDNIVLMAMRKEPQRRYPSAEHFSEDIRRYLAKQPVTARKDTVRYRTAKFASRHSIGVGAATLAVAALIATTAWAWHERGVAERRLADLRKTLTFMLVDVNQKLLESPTEGRKLLVAKAAEQLDEMARDVKNNEGLELETAQAYQQTGDIQGNPTVRNVGDFNGARKSYEKVLALGNGIKAGPNKSLVLATANIALGRLDSMSGSIPEARTHFEGAKPLYESINNKHGLMVVWEQLGKLRDTESNLLAASQSYSTSLRYAHELDDAKSSVATQKDIREQSLLYGLTLARLGQADEAAGILRDAAAIAEAIAQKDKSQIRRVGAAHEYLAYAYYLAAHLPDAKKEYEICIPIFEKLQRDDAGNHQARIDLGLSSGEFADVLWDAKSAREAQATSARALGVLKPIADSPDAKPYVLIPYARFLLAPANASRDDAAALRYVQRANAAQNGSSPDTLEALAHAYFATGDLVRAREAAQKALKLIPPSGGDVVLRNNLNGWLTSTSKTPPQ